MNQLQDIPHKQDLDRAISAFYAGADSFKGEKREYRKALVALEVAALAAVIAVEEAHGAERSAYTLEEEVRCLRDLLREVHKIRRTAKWRGRADLAATLRRVTAAWGRLADRWVNAPETTERLKANAYALATERAASGPRVTRAPARARKERDMLDAWEAAGYALD